MACGAPDGKDQGFIGAFRLTQPQLRVDISLCKDMLHFPMPQVRVIHLEAVADADAFAVVDEAAGKPAAAPKVHLSRPDFCWM